MKVCPLISVFKRQRRKDHKVKVNLSSVAIPYHKMKKGVEKIPWSTEWLLCKHQDLNSILRMQVIEPSPVVCPGAPALRRQKQMACLELTNQPAWQSRLFPEQWETISENTVSDPEEWHLRLASGCHTHTYTQTWTHIHMYTHIFIYPESLKTNKEKFSLLRIQI